MMFRRRGGNGERGAALLIALGGLALISALAAAALSLTTAPATRAAAAVAEAQATRAAEAAIHRLAAAMARQDLRGAAPMDGTVITTTFFGARIDFSAQDAAGLIDLNHASEATLRRLLVATGAEAAEAAEIASAWRAARAPGGGGGGGDGGGDDSGDGGRGGFRALEDAAEATPATLREAARRALAHATVWSGLAAVDPRVATAPALAAAANVPLDVAQGYVAARTIEGGRPPLPPAADPAGLIASDAATARLEVRAATEDGGRAAITAVIRATRSPRSPVAFLSWR